MIGEEFLMVAVPLGVLLACGAAAYFAARRHSALVLTILGLLWAGFAGVMAVGLQQASGWDGLGYAIGLILLAAPAGAGLGIGGLAGWLRGKRMIHA